MIWKWTAPRFFARRLVSRRHLARRLALISLHVFQLQFQLLDLVVELFRLAAEPLAPRFDDLPLEMLNLDSTRVELLCQADDDLLLREQHCFQGIDIVGQVGEVEHGPSLHGR